MAIVAVSTGIPLADVMTWDADTLATVLEVMGEHGGRNG